MSSAVQRYLPLALRVLLALVALPMRGRLGSLNVSAAASAIVYGILQFRKFLVDSAP